MTMTTETKPTTLMRGRLLSFHRAPQSLADGDSYLYEEDGALLIENGRISAVGPYAAVKEKPRRMQPRSIIARISSCPASSIATCISRRCR